MTIDEAIKERQKSIEVQEKLYEEACSIELKEIIKSTIDNDRQLAERLRELKKAKRLLGEALRTLNDGSCNKDCRQCKWNGNCEMSCRFAWKYGDEASALIGDSENDEP